MIAKKRFLAGLCVVAAACCASCVPCDHPLCDQKTSIADEGLIGDWLLESDGSKDPPMHISIGKKHGSPNVLEWVMTGVGEGDEVEIERHDVFTTKVGELRLATYEHEPEKKDERTIYTVWLLESPNKNTVVVSMMDPEVLAKAIEAKQLRGEVKKTWFFGWHSEPSRITSTPDELREYISATGKKCFATKNPIWKLTREVRQ